MCFGWRTRQYCDETATGTGDGTNWLALILAFLAGGVLLGSGRNGNSSARTRVR